MNGSVAQVFVNGISAHMSAPNFFFCLFVICSAATPPPGVTGLSRLLALVVGFVGELVLVAPAATATAEGEGTQLVIGKVWLCFVSSSALWLVWQVGVVVLVLVVESTSPVVLVVLVVLFEVTCCIFVAFWYPLLCVPKSPTDPPTGLLMSEQNNAAVGAFCWAFLFRTLESWCGQPRELRARETTTR